jgi:hypothetical protein
MHLPGGVARHIDPSPLYLLGLSRIPRSVFSSFSSFLFTRHVAFAVEEIASIRCSETPPLSASPCPFVSILRTTTYLSQTLLRPSMKDTILFLSFSLSFSLSLFYDCNGFFFFLTNTSPISISEGGCAGKRKTNQIK